MYRTYEAVPANTRRGFSLWQHQATRREKMAVLASVELEFWEKVFVAMVRRGATAMEAAEEADKALEERRKRQTKGP